MIKTARLFVPLLRLLLCAGLVLAPAACAPVTASAGGRSTTAPAASAIPATPTGASAGPAVSTRPAATDGPTAAKPAAGSPTAAPGASGKVIRADNAASLVATPLTLPDWVSGFFWPGPGAQIPGGARADLYARKDSNTFFPIRLEPPAAGAPVQFKIPGSAVFFSPDLSTAVAMGDNTPLTQYTLDGQQVRTFDVPQPYGASFSPDGSLLAATGGNEMSIFIFNMKTGEQLTRLTGFQTAAPVYSAGILPGNQTVYWLSRAKLQFQDIRSGEMGQALNFQDFINQVLPSSDGSRLTIAVENKLLVYQAPSAEKVAEIAVSQPVNSLSLSPDGKLLAAGYGAGIEIWDAATLAPVASLPGPNDFTGLVGFSPDGTALVSLHNGNILNIWQLK